MAQENLILHIGEGISGFDAGNFKSVSVDGSPLDSADYDVENGSILLTIHRDYLNRLSKGNHTVSVALQGGAYDGPGADDGNSGQPEAGCVEPAQDRGRRKAAAPAGALRALHGGVCAAWSKTKSLTVRAETWKKAGCSAFFPRLTPDEAGFRGKYGFIRFLQEILLDFNAAGEVYYNRFRMEQRAACRGAILHLFKFT